MKKILIPLFLFLFVFLNSGVQVSAKEGDFYDKYKGEFDEALYSENYMDMIKSYDMKTNSFNCGLMDLYCMANSTQILLGVGAMKFVFTASEYLILNPEWIVNEPLFQRYNGYFDTLTTSMMLVFLLWQILAGYLKRLSNIEDTSDLLNQKLLAVIAGGAFLAMYDDIFNIILKLQYDISDSILKFGLSPEHFLLVTLKYTPSYSIVFTFIIALIFLVFLIALIYRFVALAFFYVVGPAAIATMLNEEFNYFNLWWKYIINNVITFFLQCLAFSVAVSSLSLQISFIKNLPTGVDIVVGIIIALVVCLFALVIPSILGNMGASTGTGRSLGKMVRYIAMRK